MADYIGRFAPSPTGPLHAGSLVAALASWLDAKAHQGRWLVRIEDVDAPRCVDGADDLILSQLTAFGLISDAKPVWQSDRGSSYQQALDALLATGAAYDCGCSRREIQLASAARGEQRQRHRDLVYPGTCRPENGGLEGRPSRAVRLRSTNDRGADLQIDWCDRRLGAQTQNVTTSVGDFVLRRADGLWAYQLAVVMDDASQGITSIVRGEDLADNTARQIHLQRLLGLTTPSYLHTPLVMGPDGEKLSKQNGARSLDTSDPLAALLSAGRVLGLDLNGQTVGDVLASGALQWQTRLRSGWGNNPA
ncbi:tRNA glutamyl-Q(34) synthetase GluQRS [soil metagenome]